MRLSSEYKLLLWLPLFVKASNDFGARFLEENAKKVGVVTLASGLQYKVLRSGTGVDSPTVDSPCECHYEGRIAEKYPSGAKFDSSYDRGQPTIFAPNQVIKGWTEAMQLMVEGDKWEMYIPSDLAYGDGGHPPVIPGAAVLVFTMEIVKIKGNRTSAKRKIDSLTLPTTLPEKTSSSRRFVFNVANLVGEPHESSFILEVHPDWAPLGAHRLQELVASNFFNDCRFFRVIDGFMAQFGIHGDPAIAQRWGKMNIKDDPRKAGASNKRGTLSFATSGPDTRTTQLFLNFKDNIFLDDSGFTPVAEVVEGMDVVDRILKIGEGAPGGPGPAQNDIQSKGNAYLKDKYPQLTYIKSCKPVEDSQEIASKQLFPTMQTAKRTAIPTQNLAHKTQTAAPAQEFLPKKQTGALTAAPVGLKDLGEGLKMEVTQAGDGKTFPKLGDRLTVHYILTLADDPSGKVIDSSRARSQPFIFTAGMGEVIRGWDQGVLQMSLGQRGKLMVPSALGYGARGAGSDIPPNTDLIFDVELLGIGNQDSSASSFGIGPIVLVIFVAIVGLTVVFCTRSKKSLRRTVEMTLGKSAP